MIQKQQTFIDNKPLIAQYTILSTTENIGDTNFNITISESQLIQLSKELNEYISANKLV